MNEIKPPDGAKRRFVFKVFNDKGRHLIVPNGSGRPLLKRDGSWDKCHSDGPLSMCNNGIHGWTTWSDAYQHANPSGLYAPKRTVYLYELAEMGNRGRASCGKYVARYGRVIMKFRPNAKGMYEWNDVADQFERKFPNGKIKKSSKTF